ncbi:MAG TPA: hypothetical protein DCM67_05105 [Propionibacteriaceae bacterium]|nr:hypothetical protein [Propionibacteriaceae bacterium]
MPLEPPAWSADAAREALARRDRRGANRPEISASFSPASVAPEPRLSWEPAGDTTTRQGAAAGIRRAFCVMYGSIGVAESKME